MRRANVILLLLIFLCKPFDSHAQIVLLPVFIDGRFEDWGTQQGSETLKATSDAHSVYFHFKLQTSTVFQESSIVIWLNTDGDLSTGLNGYEIQWYGGRRQGQIYDSSGQEMGPPFFHPVIGIIVSPTIDSSVFEGRVKREIFSASTATILVEHQPTGFSETVTVNLRDHSFVTLLDTNKSEFSDVRICSYNVRQDGLWSSTRSSNFKEILSQLNSCILAFQEIYNHTATQTLSWAQGVDPSYSYSARAADCQIVSKYPILQSWALDGVTASQKNLAALIRLDADREFLLINVHLPCCSDQLGRQFELDVINTFLERIREGDESDVPSDIPVVVIGDFNFVRRDASSIADFEGGNGLIQVHAMQSHAPLCYTWENTSDRYSPGRLDWIFRSSGIIAQNSFVFRAPNQVQPSDHLPLVVDVSFDSDRDSLADRWERHHFNSLGQHGDGDFDNDGISNKVEQACRLSPTTSYDTKTLRLVDGSSALLILAWNASHMAESSFQYSTNLKTWTDLPWRLSGLEGPVRLFVELPTSFGSYFLRLKSGVDDSHSIAETPAVRVINRDQP